MVMLNKRGQYVAESSDGAVLRTGTLRNQPLGSTQFWQSAILSRLKSGFASAEKVTAGEYGEYEAIRFTADSINPYIYIIALKTDKKKLHLIEVYYPSQTVENRHGKNVKKAIGGVK